MFVDDASTRRLEGCSQRSGSLGNVLVAESLKVLRDMPGNHGTKKEE
jgi:hypothetical protein